MLFEMADVFACLAAVKALGFRSKATHVPMQVQVALAAKNLATAKMRAGMGLLPATSFRRRRLIVHFLDVLLVRLVVTKLGPAAVFSGVPFETSDPIVGGVIDFAEVPVRACHHAAFVLAIVP